MGLSRLSILAAAVLTACASFAAASDDTPAPGQTSSSSSSSGGVTSSSSTSGDAASTFCSAHADAQLCLDFDSKMFPPDTMEPKGPVENLTHSIEAYSGPDAHGKALHVVAANQLSSSFGVGLGAFRVPLLTDARKLKRGTITFRILVDDSRFVFVRLVGLVAKQGNVNFSTSLSAYGYDDDGQERRFKFEGDEPVDASHVLATQGTWHEGRMELQGEGDQIKNTISIDGKVVGAEIPTNDVQSSDSLSLALGVYDTSGNSQSIRFSVWIDDVVVEIE